MVTGEMVEELILSGADIIKVGVGPGKTGSTAEGVCRGRKGVCGLRRLEMTRREPMNGPSTSLKHISFGTVIELPEASLD